MRTRSIVLSIMLCFALPASAQVSVSVGFQVANIGVSLSTYPNLVRVPGYPVYYADGVNSNYFFYDGMYWVFETDRWYSSSWYNGPWMMVDPEFIPVYILRVPVRYYRHPPAYFVGWQANRPPRWHDHWGHDWAQRRSGWDRWDRRSAPAPAPLPTYQRKYSGERYPAADQQPVLHDRNYRHQPRDPLVRQQSRAAAENRPDRAPRGKTGLPDRRDGEPQAARPSPAPAREPAATDRQDRQPPPITSPRSEERPAQRNGQTPPRETNIREQTERQGAAPAAREPAAAERQAPRQQPARERPEQQQPINAPRSEERPVPRNSPPEPREMRPPVEPRQQHMNAPREDQRSSERGEPGQRRGQQGQSEKSDERGPDRGR